MMRIHCFQHVVHEGPGTLLEWASLHGYTVRYTNFFESPAVLPSFDEFDLLLIMGGFMNVDEERKFPWLKLEKVFIQQALEKKKQVVGICLGSQLLAAALGSRVYPAGQKEIGFFPVFFNANALAHPLFGHFKSSYPVFHWHGDTFDLPADALVAASTPPCSNQAFLIENKIQKNGEQVHEYRALGLQFHPEMNEESLEVMSEADKHEIDEGGPRVQTVEEIRKGYTYLAQNKRDLFQLMDKFIGL